MKRKRSSISSGDTFLKNPPNDEQKEETLAVSPVVDDIVRYFYGKTALIFVNSRELLEYYTDSTRKYLEKKGLA